MQHCAFWHSVYEKQLNKLISIYTGCVLQYFLISFLALSKLVAFFMLAGALFQILAAFLEKLSFSAVDFASWFHSLQDVGLSTLSLFVVMFLFGSSEIG